MQLKITALLLLCPFCILATTWQVGPTRTYTVCSQVAPLVQHGDTVTIDFATYINDPQVQWNKNNLVIKGIGGKPKLQAGSIIANDASNGKGIFVISGSNATVDNIEFANCTVIDNNGAGIRLEGANLLVQNCVFNNNEMGLLCGAIANCKLTMQNNVFANNGSTANPGYQHNVYVGTIDTFLFKYNSSINAIAEGHELKSRARYNFILYNNIANINTVDSRTIDLPNGGTSIIMGNIIEQGSNTANNNIMGYGLEGLINTAPHKLYVVNNTFINKKNVGNYINVSAGMDTLFVKNNIFAGANTGGLIVGTPAQLDSSNNIHNSLLSHFQFVDATNFNYNLLPNSPAINQGLAISKVVNNYLLTPNLQYKIEASSENRINTGNIDIGAYEYFVTAPLSIENINPSNNNNNNFKDAEVKVYPNPAKSQIYVSANLQIYNLEIKNLYGAQMFCARDLKNKQIINISNYPQGVYFVSVTKNNTVFKSIQFVKF